jgi:hypothetical protein
MRIRRRNVESDDASHDAHAHVDADLATNQTGLTVLVVWRVEVEESVCLASY